MAKIPFQDVVPPEKRSIRNIPIPAGGKRKSISNHIPIHHKEPPKASRAAAAPKIREVREPEEVEIQESFYESKPRSSKKKYVFGGIAAALIILFIGGMMTVFASATVAITPKSQKVDADMNIVAAKEVNEGSSEIKYEVIKLAQQKTASVDSGGEEAVETKASGKITIFNNYSTEPQRLIVRTRFESSGGLIYRIPESVVVPGKTATAPGSIEVEVFADEAGEKYNIKKGDFTIPGFKNDPTRYQQFYARSSTEMTGGFIGKRKTVKTADKQAAFQSIEAELKADLEKELRSKVPEGLVLLTNSIVYKSRELPQKEGLTSVEVGEEMTAYAMLLNARDLSKAITDEYISNSPDWANIDSAITDFSSLSVTGVPDNLEAASKVNLKLSGQTEAQARIDTEAVRDRLLGVPRKQTPQIMDEFAGISSITATVRPIWKQSFPQSPEKIHVEISESK